VITAIAFMLYYLASNWNELRSYSWNINWLYLIISSFMLYLAFIAAIYVFQSIFNNIAGAKLTFAQMYGIFNIANIGRYLPGKVWNILGIYVLAQEYGVNKKQTTLAVAISEVTFKGVGAFFGLGYFFFSPLLDQYLIGIVLVLAIAFIMIHPQILGRLMNFGLRLIKKGEIEINFTYTGILKHFALYSVVWIILSSAFYLFVSSLTSLEGVNTIQFLTIMPLCWIVGYIMIFAPGGIGVREGMLVLLLGEILPHEIALVIALSQRVWFTIIEGVCVATAFPILKKSKQTIL